MDYGAVLSRSWQIIWKHKVLWIFGIMAGCASGGSSGGGGGANSSTQSGNSSGALPAGIERFFEETPPETLILLALALGLLVLVVIVIAIFLGTIGRIGLIRGARQADQDESARLPFGELFRGSLPYFWRVFLLGLLVGLAAFLGLMVLILAGTLAAIGTMGLALVCLIPLICLIIPLAWALQVLIEQSTIAIVVEDLGVMDGLRRGWEVMRNNPAPMLILWLILVLGIGMIGGLIIALPMIVTTLPLLAGLIIGGEQALTAGIVILVLCCAAYLPVLILLSGILHSYMGVAWTLAYLRLTAPAAPLPETALTG